MRVTIRMIGSTQNASSASHQLIFSITMPMNVKREEVVHDGQDAAREHLVDGVHV